MIHLQNRAPGAIGIACVAALFGFATGRLSAWLVPAGTPVAAQYGSQSKPSIPLRPTGLPKQATTATTDTGLQKAAVATAGVTSRALSPAEETKPEPELTVINPGGERQRWKGQPPATTVSATGEADEGMERCRAKYRSFDPIDGTYKPYGQDTRVRCPHLR